MLEQVRIELEKVLLVQILLLAELVDLQRKCMRLISRLQIALEYT